MKYEKMRKEDMINRVHQTLNADSDETPMTKKDVTRVYETIMDETVNALHSGYSVDFPRLLIIELKTQPERYARNPNTGKRFKTDAKVMARLRPKTKLKNLHLHVEPK